MINAPMEQFVLLLRDGAIVPMQQVPAHIGEKPVECLELHVVLPKHGESGFTLYEDDGLTNHHKRGGFHRRRITVARDQGGRGRLTLEKPEGSFTPAWTTLTIHLHGETGRAKGDGDPIRMTYPRDELAIDIGTP